MIKFNYFRISFDTKANTITHENPLLVVIKFSNSPYDYNSLLPICITLN
jgi:hypothetical protein